MPRPDLLNALFASVRSVRGVGPQIAALISRLCAPEGEDAVLVDVLTHLPSAFVDRRAQTGVAGAETGTIVTLKLTIDQHQAPPPGNHKMPYKVAAHDHTDEIVLTWFVAKAPWLEKQLPEGSVRYVSGLVTTWQGQKQISHPDYMVSEENFGELPLIEPIYPLTQGLSQKSLHKAVLGSLQALPELPEWIDAKRLAGGAWPAVGDALRAVHGPRTLEEPAPGGTARSRLAYDEYLAGQITLMIVRQTLTRDRGVPRRPTGELTQKIIAALPFALTDGQAGAFEDIKGDLASGHRMARLLQGDVGSGKTLVALLAMAAVAESGAQSALMAPTELLAAQHFRTISPLCAAAGIECVLLTGKLDAADKKAGMAAVASGAATIAVGTHALFQSGVAFADLGLTVVDEQHRFGVHQRLALSEKGRKAELLVMTVTPIPRTLVLTHFGDMEVSKLPEKPAGRQKIETAVLPASAYDRVIARLEARVADG
ncbi:MAG TPA: DEAD/DEAH box helicase, partial [Devosiaceae bacterium]|nr:DEAD/DEAH box helicase [Devosiaceae bacterium]